MWRPSRRPAATSLIGPNVHAERGLVGRVASTELEQAMSGGNLPPLLAWDKSGTVRLANQAAADLLGRPLHELVGMPLVQLASPADDVGRAVADLTTGHFVALHTHRVIHVLGGDDRAVLATSRAIDIDGLRGGITAFIPEPETGGLGRHPLRTWLDLVPVAIGFVNGDWIIEMLSVEVEDLIDRTSQEVVGRSLLDLVRPDDVEELRGASDDRVEARSLPQVRFVLPSGEEVEVCVLLGPRPGDASGRRFALIGRIESYFPQQHDRVAELELRLRRIGAEVRAAGLIDAAAVPSLRNHPELGQLSARQWEILTRLVNGERVPTIAAELFISKSTVRNHLATIFQRFGVHSQAELLERLRQPTD